MFTGLACAHAGLLLVADACLQSHAIAKTIYTREWRRAAHGGHDSMRTVGCEDSGELRGRGNATQR